MRWSILFSQWRLIQIYRLLKLFKLFKVRLCRIHKLTKESTFSTGATKILPFTLIRVGMLTSVSLKITFSVGRDQKCIKMFALEQNVVKISDLIDSFRNSDAYILCIFEILGVCYRPPLDLSSTKARSPLRPVFSAAVFLTISPVAPTGIFIVEYVWSAQHTLNITEKIMSLNYTFLQICNKVMTS